MAEAVARVLDLQQQLAGQGVPKRIPWRELRVDRTYQPAYRQRPAIIRPMALEWDPYLVQALVGSLRRDGEIYLIDGATRHAAALLYMQLTGQQLPDPLVIVHHGLTVEREAQLFGKLNKERTQVHIAHRFYALVAQQEPSMVEIQGALDEHGLRVGLTPTATDISAPQVLEFLFRWGVLRETLELKQEAWPAEPLAHHRSILLGLGAFAKVFGGTYNRKDLAALLFGMQPGEILTDAVNGAVDRGTYRGRSPWAAVAALLVEEWNAGLEPANQLPPFDQPPLPRAGLVLSKVRRRSSTAAAEAA